MKLFAKRLAIGTLAVSAVALALIKKAQEYIKNNGLEKGLCGIQQSGEPF